MELISEWKKRRIALRQERIKDIAMYATIALLVLGMLLVLHHNAVLHTYLRLAELNIH